jgi:hypothetical protein
MNRGLCRGCGSVSHSRCSLSWCPYWGQVCRMWQKEPASQQSAMAMRCNVVPWWRYCMNIFHIERGSTALVYTLHLLEFKFEQQLNHRERVTWIGARTRKELFANAQVTILFLSSRSSLVYGTLFQVNASGRNVENGYDNWAWHRRW